MKKIILCISLILFIRNVDAETFYGAYYKVDNIYNEPMDEIKIEEYKLYNTYKINFIDLGYLEENNEYIKDDNDFIETETETTNKENSIEYINVKTSLNTKNTFLINNLSNNLTIKEIEIYYKDEPINYSFSNEEDFLKLNPTAINIYDKNLETVFNSPRRYINLALKLNGTYELNQLKIIIYSTSNEETTFEFKFNEYIPIKLNKGNKHVITFNNDESIKETTYTYKEHKKLYKHYKEEKISQNIYVKNGENLLLEDYKIITNYYKRDKLILSDNLIINNKFQDVENFVEYSSGKTKINHNIDYTKNAIYKCEFILNDIKVIKDILVDIPTKDTTNDIKNKETINNKASTNIKLNKQNKIKTKNKKIITTKKVENKNKIKSTKLIQTPSTLTNNKKHENINKSFIKIILIILFIVLEIIIIYKKKKR